MEKIMQFAELSQPGIRNPVMKGEVIGNLIRGRDIYFVGNTIGNQYEAKINIGRRVFVSFAEQNIHAPLEEQFEAEIVSIKIVNGGMNVRVGVHLLYD